MDTKHISENSRFGRPFNKADCAVINEAEEIAYCAAYQSLDAKFGKDTFDHSTTGGVMAVQSKTLFKVPHVVHVSRIRRMSVRNLLGVRIRSYDSVCVSFPLLRFGVEFHIAK